MTSSRRLLRPALVVLVPTVFLFGCYTEACKAYLSAVVHAPHKGFVDNVKMVRDQDGLPWVADRVVAFNETAGFYVEGAPPTFEHFLQCFYYYAIGSIVAPSRVDVEDFLDAVYYDDLGLFMLLSRIRVLSVRESDGKVDVFQGLDTTKGVNQILFPLAHKTCVGFNAYGAGNGIFCADPLERVFRPTLQLQNGVDSWVVREFSLGPKHLIALRGKAPVFTSDDGATFLQKGEGLPQFFQANDVYLSQDHAFLATNAGLYCRPLASYASGAWEKKTALPPGEVTAVAGNLWTPPNKRAWSRPLVASPFLLASLVLNGRAQTWRSDNGGMAWRLDSAGLDAARVYGMVIKPDGTAYAGTNAGMFRYTNGTWVDCSYGMGASTINSFASDVPFAAAHPGTLAATPTLFAATPGNGSGVYRSTDGGQTFAPSDSTMDHVIVNGIASSNGVVIAASSGSVARSTNGGVTWATPAASGLPASGLFLKAIAASNGVVLLSNLGAGSSFYRSTNDGVTWTGTSVPSALGYAIVPAAGAFFVGGNNAIYKSTDGGLSFATIHGITSKPFYSVVSIAVSASAVYAGTYDSSGGGGVSKSTDGGASWKDASAGLPGSAVFALLASGGTVFAGTASGLFRSTDGGGSWTVYEHHLVNATINALSASGDTLFVGTSQQAVWPVPLQPQVKRIVSIVLDVTTSQAHFTTELALANRGTTDARATLLYTASIGTKEGSGTVTETVHAGQQLVIADVIAYLRQKGLSIPAGGSQGGTLLLTFDGVSSEDVIGVTARTATATAAPQAVGRAGLAYSGIDPQEGTRGALTVYGLRTGPNDRTNLAVFNTSNVPVTVKVTAYSGRGEASPKVIDPGLTLPPYGWNQYNGILVTAGFTNGFVTVERTSADGVFSAYGVVNDQGTSDGSYLLPNVAGHPLAYINVPVLVETSAFLSELDLANSGTAVATLALTYHESLTPAAGAGGTVHVTLQPGEQQIIPNAIDFLRTHGAAIGAKGGGYAGSLHVVVDGALVTDVYAGARTASLSSAGGQFGLFTPGAYAGDEAGDEAFVYGLRADDTNRSNVAVLHTGDPDTGPVTLSLQAYDGDAAGVAKGTAETITLQPGEWHQYNDFLRGKGVRNGWVRVTRTAGTAYWILYAVVNDGAGPGQRTGDGAYVPMER